MTITGILTGYLNTIYFRTITTTLWPLGIAMTAFGYIAIRVKHGKAAASFEWKFVPIQFAGMWAAAIIAGLAIYGGIICFITS